MEDKICFDLSQMGDGINIILKEYSYPDADLLWDRNCITAELVVKAGNFSGQFATNFMTIEFENLKQGLSKLYSDLQGLFLFSPLEHQIILNFRGDGLGHFNVNIEARDNSAFGCLLKFDIDIDQTELPQLIQQINTIQQKFPIVGDLLSK